MKPEEYVELPFREVLERISVIGATQSDEEWESTLEKIVKDYRDALNNGRSLIRMRVMKTMFRTDEEE